MRLRHVSFGYGNVAVFANLTIELTARVTVLRGISGCGKTTLLKLLTGVLQPSLGTIERPPNACLVLQEDALFPWLTGEENVMALLPSSVGNFRTHPMYTTIASFAGRRATAMSFGQRRKVELFRAVLLAPPLLCLDEPFNHLDPDSRAETARFLRTETLPNTRLVVSTHLDDDMSFLAPDTYRMDGRLPVTQLKRP